MLSSKTKGLFVEINPYAILCAVASSGEPPFRIETLKSFNPQTPEAEARQWFLQFQRSKAARFVPAYCGAYPASRFMFRHSIETPAKAKDAAYLPGVMEKQRKDPSQYNAAVILAENGQPFDSSRNISSQKELLFCGAKASEWKSLQDQFVEYGVYPARLELSSAANVGGLIHYSRFKKLKLPTLVIEINKDDSFIYILSSKGLDICRELPHGLDGMLPQVRKELGLKDDDSARKLLFSDTFDFTDKGSTLLARLLKELQASIGFYEVQTGQSIGQLFIPFLPANLAWISDVISQELGVKTLRPQYSSWLESMGIESSDDIDLTKLEARWHSLLCLMGDLTHTPEEKDGKEKG